MTKQESKMIAARQELATRNFVWALPLVGAGKIDRPWREPEFLPEGVSAKAASWHVESFDRSATTAIDIVSKLVKFGSISEKQWAYLAKLGGFLFGLNTEAMQAHLTEKMAAKQAEQASASPAPKGRVQVTGEVASVKMKFTQFGDQLKMLVKSDDGFKVWSSVPASLADAEVKAGDRIEFTVTLKPSDDDETFAFGSRPAKAQVLTPAA